jgi:ankyrin repeat protein
VGSVKRQRSEPGALAPRREKAIGKGIHWIIALVAVISAFSLLSLPAVAAGQQEHSISGRVVDSKGRPVRGARVSAAFPETGNGEWPTSLEQATDANGRFALRWGSGSSPSAVKLFVCDTAPPIAKGPEVVAIPLPEVLWGADPRYAGRPVDLTRGTMLNLGDIPVQIHFGVLVVKLSGAKAQISDAPQPGAGSGLSVRVWDIVGDFIGASDVPVEAVRNSGSAFAFTLPEGQWRVEVSKDGDKVWHGLAAAVTVRAGAEQVAGPVDMLGGVGHAADDAILPDAASSRRELARLGVECSERSLILRGKAHNDRVAALLLGAGVDPNLRDPDSGDTMLIEAVDSRDMPIIRALLRAGADLEAGSRSGTALDVAALDRREDSEIVRLLLDAGADPNSLDNGGNTALIDACAWGNSETVRMLLAAGADPNRVTKDGSTALNTAEAYGLPDMPDILTRAGAKRQQQQHSISGRVVDGAGHPVQGAWVSVPLPGGEGSEEAPVFSDKSTDASGRFTLRWESGSNQPSVRLFVCAGATPELEVLYLPFPEVLSRTDPRYAGKVVDLSRSPEVDLGDIPAQVYFGILVVRLAGAKAQMSDPPQPADQSGLILRVRDMMGDVISDSVLQSGAVREGGSAFAVSLPEGKWSIEVAKDDDNTTRASAIWHTLPEPATVRTGAEQVAGPVDMLAGVTHAADEVVMADAASSRRELARLGVECSERSLMLHVQASNDKVVALLLGAGIDPNLRDPEREYTMLMEAVENRDIGVIRALIKAGADLEAGLRGFTPLDVAVLNTENNSGIVELLLKAGADPNGADDYRGYTPLIFACTMGDLETVRMLLAAGADPSHVAKDGKTPLSMAEGSDSTDIVHILRRAGAKR